MSTQNTSLSYAMTSNGISLSGQGDSPIKTPAGLLVTRAVEVKDGWVGQIIVDKTIVWEGAPTEDEKAALTVVNGRVVTKLSALLGGE